MGSKASSSNEDWKNWMAVHGKPQEVVDDVCVIGKSTGFKIKGDCSNMFSALSKGRGDGIKNEG